MSMLVRMFFVALILDACMFPTWAGTSTDRQMLDVVAEYAAENDGQFPVGPLTISLRTDESGRWLVIEGVRMEPVWRDVRLPACSAAYRFNLKDPTLQQKQVHCPSLTTLFVPQEVSERVAEMYAPKIFLRVAQWVTKHHGQKI